MIVYLSHHAFGVTKVLAGTYTSREFPIGDDIGEALAAAKRWERHGRAVKKPRKEGGKVGHPYGTGTIGAARIGINQRGDTVYIVPYRNKQGIWRRIQVKLPSIGADEVKREAQRMAHVMAGKLSEYSPDAPLR